MQLQELFEADISLDKSTRLSSAKQMGYDTSVVWYHGTPSNTRESNNKYVRSEGGDADYPELIEFDTNAPGVSDSQWYGRGAYFTPDADYAFEFGNIIIPVYLRMRKPFIIIDDHSTGFDNWLRMRKSLEEFGNAIPKKHRINRDPLPKYDIWYSNDGEELKNYLSVTKTTWGKGHSVYKEGDTSWIVLNSREPNSKTGSVGVSGNTKEEVIIKYWDDKRNYDSTMLGWPSTTIIAHDIGSEQFTNMLKKRNYDSVLIYRLTNNKQTLSEAVIFYSNDIRSVHAKFDPVNKESGNILD